MPHSFAEGGEAIGAPKGAATGGLIVDLSIFEEAVEILWSVRGGESGTAVGMVQGFQGPSSQVVEKFFPSPLNLTHKDCTLPGQVGQGGGLWPS
jgi:hypothetical protein